MPKFPQRQPQFQFGFQGRQGVSGTRGPQGFKGISGEDGLQGSQGYQGSQGLQGNQGTVGPTPSQGSQGSQGYQGMQGAQGNQGLFADLQGSQGWYGSQGLQGFQGDKYGIIGAQGRQGASGRQGFEGFDSIDVHGAQGYQSGLRGPQGVQGHQGPVGWQGFQGYADDGLQGNQGHIGIGLGDRGAQGHRSTYGRAAPAGAQGLQGPQGILEEFDPTNTVSFIDNFTGERPLNSMDWWWRETGYGREPVISNAFDKPVLELRSGFDPVSSAGSSTYSNYAGIYLAPSEGRSVLTIDENNLGRFDARIRVKGVNSGDLEGVSNNYSLIFGLVSDVNNINRVSAVGDAAYYLVDHSVLSSSFTASLHINSVLRALFGNFSSNVPGYQKEEFENYDNFIKDLWYDISIRFELNEDISTEEPGAVRMKIFYKREFYDDEYVDASVTYEEAIPALSTVSDGLFDPTFDRLENVVPLIGVCTYTDKEQVAYVDYFKMTLGRSS